MITTSKYFDRITVKLIMLLSDIIWTLKIYFDEV